MTLSANEEYLKYKDQQRIQKEIQSLLMRKDVIQHIPVSERSDDETKFIENVDDIINKYSRELMDL